MKKLIIKLISWLFGKPKSQTKPIDKEAVKKKIEEIKVIVEPKKSEKQILCGRLVWNSKLLGTYIRVKHGELK